MYLRLSHIALVAIACSIAFADDGRDEKACSTASLSGSYGFHGLAFIEPGATPRAIIGVFTFDGRGAWNANLIVNDAKTGVSQPPNTGPGTYVVNPDCTGTLRPSSGGSVAIVVVDGGHEFYQMRTDPSNIVLFGTTKKVQASNP